MSRVTIIIPVYNGERFLRPLLDSVLAQTNREWTCLCVNDGSTDGSRTILSEYAALDPRIKVVDQANGGCGTARNTAIALVDTPYVMFADQDDILHPQSFEIAVCAIEQSDVDCLCFGFERFTDTPLVKTINEMPTVRLTTRNGTDLITGRRDSWPIFVWRHIFRTAAVRDIPFPPVSGGEDQAWMGELSWMGLKWASIEPTIYFNRQDPHSRSRGVSRRYIDNIFESYAWTRQRAMRHPLDGKWLRRYIRHMALMFTISVFYRSPRNGPYAIRKLMKAR